MANFSTEDASFEQETSYATILYAPHKTNKNCYFAVLLLKENYYSKRQSSKKLEYIKPWRDGCTYDALCEGDDYWIHPHKLQMQTDFLDSHEDYVMCHTDFRLTNNKYKNHIRHFPEGDDYRQWIFFKGIRVNTLTSMYRIDVFNRLPHLWVGKGWMMGDWPLWIELSQEGKLKYMPIVTSCYRILSQSASHGSLEFELRGTHNALLEVRKFYADYYGIQLPNDGYTKQLYIDCMKIAFKHNNIEVAKKYKAEADQKKMTSPKMYFFYYATIIKPIAYLLHKILPY